MPDRAWTEPMTDRDENDLTDEELVEMWKRGEPVEMRQPSDPPTPRGADERPKREPGAGTTTAPRRAPRTGT